MSRGGARDLLGLFVRAQRAQLFVYLVLALGTALSVFVVCWLLSLRQGFIQTAGATGRADQMLVLRRGASNEVESYVDYESVMRIEKHPMVDRDAQGRALASAEIYAIAEVRSVGQSALSVSVRGLGQAGIALRPEFRIVRGRAFAPGAREVVVGSSIARVLGGVDVGSELRLRDRAWLVVGVFDSGGEVYESEVWTDVSTLANAFGQGGLQSMTVRISDPARRAAFAEAVRTDPSLNHVAMGEREYFSRNAVDFSATLSTLAWIIGAVMVLSACVASANSMLYLTQLRRYQIGVLRSIGFRSSDILRAVLAEGALLTCIGAALGWLAAWVVLDGRSVNTLNMQTLSQLAFRYSVDWHQAVVAAVVAGLAAVLGGFWPARRATREATVKLLVEE